MDTVWFIVLFVTLTTVIFASPFATIIDSSLSSSLGL